MNRNGDRAVDLDTELMTLSIGPQHPATHGTLQIEVLLDGERIVKATPTIGYLHRGSEKLAENLLYHQWIPYTDRFNYMSPLANNVAYVMAVEKLLGVEAPPRAQYIRVICVELSRIADHLVWLGAHGIDLGAFTVFLWAFKSRERLYDIFECLGGQRMHTSCMRIGGLWKDLPEGFEERVKNFITGFPGEVDEYERLLTRNKIWHKRTRGIGVISKEDAISYGFSGPNLRACGIEHDLRRKIPYLVYGELEFEIPVGENGDVFDRYLVRIEELRQSARIVAQCLEKLPDGPINVDDPHMVLPPKEAVYTKMEELIYHFKIVMEGVKPPPGEVYSAIEAPNGEHGYYIVSDGSSKPYRIKVRTPSFANYAAFPQMVEGHMVSDLVAVLASLNIIAGELDR